MDTFDAVAYINQPRWQKVSLGLARTQLLLDKLGRPQDSLRFVHVAGTNGKGSTCAYIDSILRQAGYRTGLFTSPYILCFEERIRVNGQNISADSLQDITLRVRAAALQVEAELGEHPTEFELMTAVALCYFAREDCDIVVLEVGLGGRLDSTNIIERPEVCVITPIALDHTALLGETVPEVAAEKAGILKPGAPVVSWPQELPAMEVVRQRAEELGCPLTVMNRDELQVKPLGFDAASTLQRSFSYKGICYQTALLGSYQPANAAMALEVAYVLRRRGWEIPAEAEQRGIASAQWPGRFEVVANLPLTIIDGGHNPQGAQALADSLQEVLAAAGQARATFVMGVLADKDYRSMIRAVLPVAERFIVYPPANPRALAAEDLAAAIAQEAPGMPVAVAPDAAAAMLCARTTTPQSSIVAAFGSLYAIADLKRALRGD